MPNYTFATLQNAVDALGSRLYDETNQQWTVTELSGYVTESLRTWNALAGFWRTQMSFLLTTNAWWYDLRTVSGTVIPYTVTKYDLITQIENHLLEPPTPAAWSGSAQFTLEAINAALQRRQDDLLGSSGCTLTRSTPAAATAIRTTLADTTIDIRRIAWLPGSGPYTNKPLRQSDMWAERAFYPTYTTVGALPPTNWMQNTEPPPSFDVDTVPPVTGTYDVLSVDSGPAWTAGSNGTLTIPDDWTWVLKWGAMADLFSNESNAKDAMRADYCMRRYREGMAMLMAMPTVLALRINGIPIGVDSVRAADDYNSGWQAAAASTPNSAYAAGNLLAFSPKPDSSSAYTVQASVVQNAPVPALLTDFIQIARDDYDAIIDYAQHLALVKTGGLEFLATVMLYQNFQRKAAQYNSKLKEMGFFQMPQADLSQLQQQRVPTYSAGTDLSA